MKSDHGKHEQNHPMTIQLDNIQNRNIYVKSFTLQSLT